MFLFISVQKFLEGKRISINTMYKYIEHCVEMKRGVIMTLYDDSFLVVI